jgi:alpha-L-fucosidase
MKNKVCSSSGRQMHRAVFIVVLSLMTLMGAATLRAQNAFRERLLPTSESYGFRMDDYWVWCGSVIKGDDGKYHMFASRWPQSLSFGPHWLTNSEVVHAVSDTPEGPFSFSDVALPPRGEEFWDGKMTHNPAIRKYGDTYLLYYTGTTYHGAMPDANHPVTNESPLKQEAHRNERIGLAVSKSPYGPWKRYDRPILDVVPNSWEQYLVANPAPFVFEDGRVMLYYKGVEQLGKHAVSVAFADHWSGPYERLSDKPLNMGIGAEDPTIWYEDGMFQALMLDHGRKFSDKGIYYAYSKDGLQWTIDNNPAAITNEIQLNDGTIARRSATERPWVLVEDGKATHVYFATKNAKGDGPAHSWNMCIPLKAQAECTDPTAWFKEAGLGMFIHWGLYSEAAGMWDGKPISDERYINPYCEHIMLLNEIPNQEYARLAETFHPTSFDADAIVRAAKAAGMKYIVYTTKHHDGFAMYDSQVSDYNIVQRTPYRQDPLRLLSEACRREGVRLCLYYSLGRDWAEADAVSREARRNYWDFPDTTGLSYQRYLDRKVKPQLHELLTNYGPVSMVFFDTPELTTLKQSIDLELFIKRIQPNCIINTRAGNDVGDIVEMADNVIPVQKDRKPWECPATMAESWGYSVLDTEEYWKSSAELIEKLVEIRTKGGNYLLNIGPDGAGRVPKLATTRLKDIAQWMEVNAEAVYGVQPTSDKISIHNGYVAQKGDCLYLYVRPQSQKHLLLYIDPKSVAKVSLLTPKGEKAVKFHAAYGHGICITLPSKLPCSPLSVIKVQRRDVTNKVLEIED